MRSAVGGSSAGFATELVPPELALAHELVQRRDAQASGDVADDRGDDGDDDEE